MVLGSMGEEDMKVELFEGFDDVVFRPGDDPTAVGVDSGW